MEPDLELGFLLNQGVKAVLFVLIHYGNGLLVEYKNVKVNYTRKINHFAFFLIPVAIERRFAYEEEYGLFVLGAAVSVLKFALFLKPVRERISIIKTMFQSFDRPEDRPFTLLWLSTQVTVGYFILFPMGILFALNDLLPLLLIPILITGIGDGLAEPVGIRFGKHKYRASALFSHKKYVRTLEGSACVFLTSLLVVAAHYTFFTPLQFGVAMAAVPVLMTLAEAFSPHTWDTPFLYLVGYLSLFAISFL